MKKFLLLSIICIAFLQQKSFGQCINSWQPLGGNDFNQVDYTPGGIDISLDTFGYPNVLVDSTTSTSSYLIIRRFNGVKWVTVANSALAVPSNNGPYSFAINKFNVPYILYKGTGVFGGAYVIKFNGTNWVNVGASNFSTGSISDQSIVFDNTGAPYVSYADAGNSILGKAIVKKFNGSSWNDLTLASSFGISASVAQYIKIAINKSGVPFIVFQDANATYKATVMKFNGTNWVNVGVGISSATVQGLSIATDTAGLPYIAYPDSTLGNKISVLKYNGSSWVNVGSLGFSVGAIEANVSITIDKNNNPIVAYQDVSLGKEVVMQYNGTVWNNVGTSSIASYNNGLVTNTVAALFNRVVVDKNNAPIVGFMNGTNSYSSVLKYNGTAWNYMGDIGFSKGVYNSTFNCVMASDTNGTPHVAFLEKSSKASVMEYNGTTWNYTGNSNFSPSQAGGIALTFARNGKPYSVFNDFNQNNKSTVMVCSGGVWSQVGITSTNNSTSLLGNKIVCNRQSNPIILKIDPLNQPLVEAYNGTNWVSLGYINIGPYLLSGPNWSDLAISKQDTIYAGYNDYQTPNQSYIVKYNGTNWVLVGGTHLATSIFSLAISSSGVPYVAFIDSAYNNKCSVVKLVNNGWVYVGNPGFSSGTISNLTLKLDPSDAPIVAYSDGSVSSKATIKKLNGTTWVTFLTQGITAIESISLSMDLDNYGRPMFVYQNDGLWAYGYNNQGTTYSNISKTICSQQNYNFYGKSIHQQGVYYDTLTNNSGCDSIVVLHLNIKNDTTVTSYTSCTGSYNFYGRNLTHTGKYYDTLTNQVGCDSLLILNLVVNHPTYDTFSYSICGNGGSYLFNGHLLTSTGYYKDTLINFMGCDSFLTLHLIASNSIFTNFTQTICSPNNYTFQGKTYSSAGMYYDTLQSYLGCDSILALNLLVKSRSFSNQNVSICSNQYYNFNGVNYSGTGVYKDTLTNYLGCDSIVSLNLSAGIWQPLGPDESNCASYGSSNGFNIVKDNANNFYVATCDYGISSGYYGLVVGKLNVRKYNGNNWADLGTTGITNNSVLNPFIALDTSGIPYVTFSDSLLNGKISVVRFNGSAWSYVGSQGFNGVGYTDNTQIAFDKTTNTPYVMYRSWSGFKPTVMKFNGSAWVNVGISGFTPNTIGCASFALDNNGVPYVAFSDNSQSYHVSVMMYNGSTWSYVGNAGFSPSSANKIDLKFDKLGNLFVSYHDNSSITVMKYFGSTWNLVGSAYFTPSSSINNTSLAIDTSGIPYVSFNDASNSNFISTMKFNGTSWSYVGNTGFLDGTNYLSMLIDNNNQPVVSGAVSRIFVKKYNGSNWISVGDSVDYGLSVQQATTQDMAIDKHGNPYVIFDDLHFGKMASVKKYSNNTWSYVGSPGFSGSGAISNESIEIDTLGIPYVVYQDNGLGYPVVKKFNGTSWVSVGSPIVNSISTINVNNVLAVDKKTNIVYCAVSDNTNHTTIAYFNGASWVSLGSISGYNLQQISMCIDRNHNVYLAFYNGSMVVEKYNGSSWSVLGGYGININYPAPDVFIKMALDTADVPYIVATDFYNPNQNVSVYKFLNSTWNPIGNTSFSDGVAHFPEIKFDKSNTPYVAYKDINNSGRVTVKKLNGNTWGNFGNNDLSFGGGNYPTLEFGNNKVFVSYTNDGEWAQVIDGGTNYVTINKSICGGQPYVFNGHTYTTSGVYYDTLSNSGGCDSIVTLNLTVGNNSTHLIAQTICGNQTYSFHNHSLNTTGTYYDTLPNYTGCDSIITLNLTVKPISTHTITQSICSNGSYAFNNHNLTAAGTYYDTLTNYVGCDSIITLHLTIKSISNSSFNQNICNGTSYTFNNHNLTTQGVYYDTLTNYMGCDSIVALHLYVNTPSSSSINGSICNGNSYNFNGQALSTAGTYKDTLTNYLGCDSIITLHLSVGNASASTLNHTMCSSQSYSLNGKTFYTAGTYYDTIQNYQFCDSIITLHLSVLPSSASTMNHSICSNQTYGFNGHNLNSAGTYYDTLTNYLGCDSLITLHLTIKPTSASTTSASICAGNTYTFNGNTYNAAGSYTAHLTNYVGCDSAATLVLTIKPTSTSTTNAAICNGQSYTFNGNTYTTPGTYTVHLTNYLGCDSAAVLNLTYTGNITPTATITATTSTTICNGAGVSFHFASTNAGATPVYTIYINGNLAGPTLNDTITIPNLLNNDSVYVTITNNAPCVFPNTVKSNVIVIHVLPAPVALFTLVPDPNNVPHHWFAVNQSTGTPPLTYTWNWGDGSANSIGQNPSHLYSTGGYYNICVTVQDGNSCTNSFCLYHVLTRDAGSNSIVTVNVVDTFPTKTITGINEVKTEDVFSIVPNPCSTCEVLLNTNVTANELQITDLLGKKIEVNFTKSAKGYLIDMPNQSAGIYFIRNTKTGQVVKFVKE